MSTTTRILGVPQNVRLCHVSCITLSGNSVIVVSMAIPTLEQSEAEVHKKAVYTVCVCATMVCCKSKHMGQHVLCLPHDLLCK